jgi:hypothetical protein
VLDPRTICVAIPCYDGKLMAELSGCLQMCSQRFAALSLPTECSHISLQRNLIAANFLASPFEWLVCIDNDTVPSPRDMELLLEPCDTSAEYWDNTDPKDEGAPSIFTDRARPPRPTRIVTGQCTPGRPLDEKTGAAADVLVCAEYSYKDDTLRPCRFGMGFVRIHRSVFETLQELKHDGGPTIEVQRHLMEDLKKYIGGEGPVTADILTAAISQLILASEDKAGTPRLWQATHQGRLYHDYFPTGPILSQFVPSANWQGEDHGFFTLCHLAGIIPRIETRTRLLHIGRKAYPYLGPDGGGGQ